MRGRQLDLLLRADTTHRFVGNRWDWLVREWVCGPATFAFDLTQKRLDEFDRLVVGGVEGDEFHSGGEASGADRGVALRLPPRCRAAGLAHGS